MHDVINTRAVKTKKPINHIETKPQTQQPTILNPALPNPSPILQNNPIPPLQLTLHPLLPILPKPTPRFSPSIPKIKIPAAKNRQIHKLIIQ